MKETLMLEELMGWTGMWLGGHDETLEGLRLGGGCRMKSQRCSGFRWYGFVANGSHCAHWTDVAVVLEIPAQMLVQGTDACWRTRLHDQREQNAGIDCECLK